MVTTTNNKIIKTGGISMNIKPEVLEYAHERLTEICITYAKVPEITCGIRHELLAIIYQGIQDYRELIEFKEYALKRFEEADEMLAERRKIIEEYEKKMNGNRKRKKEAKKEK